MTILVSPLGLKMDQTLAATDAIEDGGFFRKPIRRDDPGDRMADDLGCGVAKQIFRRGIPGRYGAVEILADNRVVGRFRNHGEPCAGFFKAGQLVRVRIRHR